MDKGRVFITDNLIYTASRLPTYHSQGVLRTWNEKKHEKSKACAIKSETAAHMDILCGNGYKRWMWKHSLWTQKI